MPRYAWLSSSAWSIRLRRSRAKKAKRPSSGTTRRIAKRLVVGHDREKEAGGREGGVDEVHGRGEAELSEHRDVERVAGPDGGAGEVECELGEQHEPQQGQHRPGRRRLAGHGENERRPERMPGAEDFEERALAVHAPAREVERRAKKEAERDAERHQRHGQQEEHRHEHDLRGYGEARARPRTRPARPGRRRRREGRARPARPSARRRGEEAKGTAHARRTRGRRRASRASPAPPAARSRARARPR